MTSREKMLAAALGVTVVVCVFGYLGVKYAGWIDAAGQDVSNAQNDIIKDQKTIGLGKKAAKQMAELEQRSLPSNLELARSRYQSWLLEATKDLENVNLTTSVRARGKIYDPLAFTMRARGNLAQLTEFLYTFHNSPTLHRLDTLRVTPIKDSNDLDLSMTISAIAIKSAEAEKELPQGTSHRLELASLDEYQERIQARNVFGPPNSPPSLRVPSRERTYPGEEVSVSIRASDSDDRDEVTMRLIGEYENASLDESGKFKWQAPMELGTYEFEIAAKDNGMPNKEVVETLTIEVVKKPDPPPMVVRQPDPEPPPRFDHANHTVLTAVTERNGVPMAWILNRPTAEMLKLEIGDDIRVGSITGVLMEVGEREIVILEKDGSQRIITLGEVLSGGMILPAEKTTSADDRDDDDRS